MSRFATPQRRQNTKATRFTFSNQLPISDATRLVLAAGVIVALCIVGDSFLYSILPLEAADLGIALPLVGVLLSANRLVRLVSNTWVSGAFERWGPRRPFVAATMLSLFTTVVYALGRGFVVFLPARLGWGIAWSALRQGGYQAIWTGGPNQRGRLMGLLWGIIRLGSAVSVVAGGYLRDRFGYQTGILAVMAATVSAIPLVLAMRWPPEAHRQAQTFEVSQTSKVLPREAHRQTQTFEAAETSKVLPREAHRQARTFEVSQTSKVLPRERKAWLVGLWEMWRSALGRRAFIAGFIYALVEGVLISTASLFLASRLGTGELLGGLGVRVATVAGLVLAVRWTSDILFGPAIGALSDRLGQPTALVLLATTLLAGIIGVTLLADAGLVLCLMVVFVSSSGLNITLGAIANSLALEAERPHLFIGAYTTAADAGSALGPLLAYSASALVTMNGLYVFGGGALLVASLLYWRAWRTRQLTGEGSLTPDTFFDSRRSSE